MEAAEKVGIFRKSRFEKLQSVSNLAIAEDHSTVGCGPCGRPKWHVIPTQSDNCPACQVPRAATRARLLKKYLTVTNCKYTAKNGENESTAGLRLGRVRGRPQLKNIFNSP